MEGSSNVSAVTPEGVRAGDRAALQALVDRRGPAVVAFCTQVCGPQAAARAAAEAFARFRAAVRDAPDPDAVDPESLLRGATRHAAASMARTPSGPPPHGRLRSRGTQTCEHVPTMLAARANGALGEADLDRLARHLDRCERCAAMAEIFRRAELAYQDPAVDTLGTDISTLLLSALEAVSPQAIGVAPAPAPSDPAPATPPLEGAFGHLPELEDEVPVEAVGSEPAAEPEPVAPAPVLPVDQVVEPAEELEAADLAAEPLPEAPPAEDELGETMEWDNELPEVAPRHVGGAVAAPPLLEGGQQRRERSRWRPVFLALPVVLVAGMVVAALALAGVFGGSQGAGEQQRPVAPNVQPPVTTPLPVTVPAATTPTATTGVPVSTDTVATVPTVATTATPATTTTTP